MLFFLTLHSYFFLKTNTAFFPAYSSHFFPYLFLITATNFRRSYSTRLALYYLPAQVPAASSLYHLTSLPRPVPCEAGKAGTQMSPAGAGGVSPTCKAAQEVYTALAQTLQAFLTPAQHSSTPASFLRDFSCD